MGFKLTIKNGSKLTIDPGKQIILKWVFERPDVLSLYSSTDSFKAFVPHLSFNDRTNKVTLTNLNDLKALVNDSIVLKNSKIGEFSTTFADARLFQVGIIITRPHRHNRTDRPNGRKRAEKLPP